jgi:hypothetical protein
MSALRSERLKDPRGLALRTEAVAQTGSVRSPRRTTACCTIRVSHCRFASNSSSAASSRTVRSRATAPSSRSGTAADRRYHEGDVFAGLERPPTPATRSSTYTAPSCPAAMRGLGSAARRGSAGCSSRPRRPRRRRRDPVSYAARVGGRRPHERAGRRRRSLTSCTRRTAPTPSPPTRVSRLQWPFP